MSGGDEMICQCQILSHAGRLLVTVKLLVALFPLGSEALRKLVARPRPSLHGAQRKRERHHMHMQTQTFFTAFIPTYSSALLVWKHVCIRMRCMNAVDEFYVMIFLFTEHTHHPHTLGVLIG